MRQIRKSFRKNKREKKLKKGGIKLPQSHSLDIWGNRTSSWIDDAIYELCSLYMQ
jgi:hypothetical protein